ncbi:MAG: hypothetical protein ACLR5Q_01230 [Coprococcus sp.]
MVKQIEPEIEGVLVAAQGAVTRQWSMKLLMPCRYYLMYRYIK